MNETALKNLIRCKFELAHAMIDFLPETIQEPLRNSEREILRALNEAINDYLEEDRASENNNERGLKTIEVEG